MDTEKQVGKTRFTMPSEREVVATREFEAPRQVVWEAHTDCEHLPQWMLGPEGWTMPVCEMDFRPGGRWHYLWRQADGSEMEMHGEFREISPPERIVHTELWGEEWPETVNTTVLTEHEGKTIVTVTARYASQEVRDKALAMGMLEGWSASYDLLDEYLPTLRQSFQEREVSEAA